MPGVGFLPEDLVTRAAEDQRDVIGVKFAFYILFIAIYTVGEGFTRKFLVMFGGQ